ncbi:MAG: hypothetical protein K8T89_02945 [Planctomycetes bacterium]|nr:hypothetical protein [Planctomycetota bacterium]
MYSMILMMAVSSAPESAAFGWNSGCQGNSCHGTSCHGLIFGGHGKSCHGSSCHGTSCHGLIFGGHGKNCHGTSCHGTSCHGLILGGHGTSCHGSSCHGTVIKSTVLFPFLHKSGCHGCGGGFGCIGTSSGIEYQATPTTGVTPSNGGSTTETKPDPMIKTEPKIEAKPKEEPKTIEKKGEKELPKVNSTQLPTPFTITNTTKLTPMFEAPEYTFNNNLSSPYAQVRTTIIPATTVAGPILPIEVAPVRTVTAPTNFPMPLAPRTTRIRN